MLFDQPRELPIATVRRAPGARIELLLGDLHRWLLARWQWCRPRTIPALFALAGMMAVIQSINYLSRPIERSAASAPRHADPPTIQIEVSVLSVSLDR